MSVTLEIFLKSKADEFIAIQRKLMLEPVTKQGASGNYQSSLTTDSALYKSLRKEVKGEGFNMSMNIYAASYYFFAESGRGPGGRPPVSEIEAWAIRKGKFGNDPKVIHSIAWAIANTIATRGSGKPPYAWLEKSLGLFEADFKKAVREQAVPLFFDLIRERIAESRKKV